MAQLELIGANPSTFKLMRPPANADQQHDSAIAPQATTASAAFEAAMLSCLEAVMRYARMLTRDHSDADDLVQETYLRAFRSWHTFDMSSDPRRWLFAICRHAFLRIRQREMRVTSVDEELGLDALAAVSVHKSARDEGLERVFDRVDLAPALSRALAGLSDAHRVVVVMVDVDGLGYAEAAAELKLPIGTVRSRLFRARRQLQEELIDYARDAGYSASAVQSNAAAADSTPGELAI